MADLIDRETAYKVLTKVRVRAFPYTIKDFLKEMNNEMIKDSGQRREFHSGAVRDIQEGKGRCDLLPLREVAELVSFGGEDQVLMDINFFMQTKDVAFLRTAISEFVFLSTPDGSMSTAMLEVAKHYEEGCNKYGERNWQKGIPLHCYIDSGVRHYLKFKRGDDDERHDRAFIWNMLGAIWTYRNRPECDDLPGQRHDILQERTEGETGEDKRHDTHTTVVISKDGEHYTCSDIRPACVTPDDVRRQAVREWMRYD